MRGKKQSCGGVRVDVIEKSCRFGNMYTLLQEREFVVCGELDRGEAQIYLGG